MILMPDQLQLLTNKRRSAAQVRELKAMGIPYRVRSDGTPVVLTNDLVSSSGKASKPKPRLRL